MQLLIDIGNSRVKWALFDGRQLMEPGQASHDDRALARGATDTWQVLQRPSRVIASVVANEQRAAELTAWCARHWGLAVELVRSSSEACGVINAYPNPRQLGSDRWATLVAARAQAQGVICIVDAGTAITIDVLDSDGRHLGGLISAGFSLMRRSLARDTGNIDYERAANQLGEPRLLTDNTRDAVLNGTLHAAVAMVDRVVEQLRSSVSADMDLVITGGDALQLLPLLRFPFRHEPHLVLEGLAVIAGWKP